jgi:hypothetical protein
LRVAMSMPVSSSTTTSMAIRNMSHVCHVNGSRNEYPAAQQWVCLDCSSLCWVLACLLVVVKETRPLCLHANCEATHQSNGGSATPTHNCFQHLLTELLQTNNASPVLTSCVFTSMPYPPS